MAKTTKELQALYDNSEACFGKLFDGTTDDCKKCADKAECDTWQESEGNPAKAKKGKPAPAKAAPAKKEEVKSAPAKAEKAKPAPKADKPKVAPPKKERAVDENGFTEGSTGSKIYKLLLEGTHTKADMETTLDVVGKSTVGTFLSDIQRAVGVYSISRGIKILKGADGVLTIEGSAAPAKKGKK